MADEDHPDSRSHHSGTLAGRLRRLPGLRSERQRTRLLAAIFYVCLIVALLVEFRSGLLLMLLSIALWMAYCQRGALHESKASGLTEETVGWCLVGCLCLLLLILGAPAPSVAPPPSPTPSSTKVSCFEDFGTPFPCVYCRVPEAAPIAPNSSRISLPTPADFARADLTESEAATAVPDEDGYLPAPRGFTIVTVTLSSSSCSDLLAPLQADLDRHDADSLAAMMRVITTVAPIGFMHGGDMQGPARLESDFARTILKAYFDQGSTPKIQGFFKFRQSEDVTRAAVFTYRYVGSYAIATPTMPLATSDGGEIEGMDYSPKVIDSEVSMWIMGPETENTWDWHNWYYGDIGDTYEDVVRTTAEILHTGTYYLVRP